MSAIIPILYYYEPFIFSSAKVVKSNRVPPLLADEALYLVKGKQTEIFRRRLKVIGK